MASIDPKIQSRLIRDLEPAVAVELERHVATTKDWVLHTNMSHGVRVEHLPVH